MKKIFYILGLFLPLTTSAHVKWFVDSDEVVKTSHGTMDFYSFGSLEVIVWIFIVFIAVLFFKYIDKKIPEPKKIQDFAYKNQKNINRIAQTILGLFLITVSFIWKIIIIPEIHVADTLTVVVAGVQVLIGLMYVFNIKPKVASVGLMAFCLNLIVFTGVVSLLENAMLLSLAVYFFIIHSESDSFANRMKKYAVEIVRMGTGISLIVLAFTEKLLYPELSLKFLEIYKWNFMTTIFPWFSDKLFVLSTGFAEIIFGILFIFGYMTRTTTIFISVFFACSVVTMLLGSHAWEVEDLVVYSAAILFLFYGYGKTKFFVEK